MWIVGPFESSAEAVCANRWQDFLTQAARVLGSRRSANRRVAGYPVTGLPLYRNGRLESPIAAGCAIRWQDFLTQAARVLGLRRSANRRVAGYPVTGLPFTALPRFTLTRCLFRPARHHVRVEQNDESDDARKEDAVFQSEAEKARLVLAWHARRGGGHSDALQADHFPHHATARIRRGHQRGIQMQRVCGDHLQIDEQRVY